MRLAYSISLRISLTNRWSFIFPTVSNLHLAGAPLKSRLPDPEPSHVLAVVVSNVKHDAVVSQVRTRVLTHIDPDPHSPSPLAKAAEPVSAIQTWGRITPVDRKREPHQLVSIQEAARRLGVTQERVRQLARSGVLESYQLDGWDKVFLLRDEVDGYLAWKEKEKG